MMAKMPLSGSSSTPKSAWHFTVPPSPPTLAFLLFESLMMPWALPKSLRTTSRKAVPDAISSTHLVPLLRQSIYSRLAGYDDTNDAVRLSQDPAMRVIVGWQGSERKGASTSEMGRFETEFLTQEGNRQALARMNTRWVERAMAHTLHQRVILDMDSSESPVHGQQEGAAYNGHFECVCYHPLFLFNQFGDCEGAKLRSGNLHSADDWQEVLDPVVERYFTAAVRLLFRADAAFAKPEIYEYLETRQIDYAIRLPANEVL